MRGWIWCFLLTAIVFMLQLIPQVGVVLMIFGAPFASVILINLGFVLMARDALTGIAPRLLLLFPISWFGGYAIATTTSHYIAEHKIRDALAYNAGKRVPFYPLQQDLLIHPDRNDDNFGAGLRYMDFVEQYGLNKVFQTDAGLNGAMTSYTLTGMVCPSSVV